MDALAALRERIQHIEGRPATQTGWRPSGVAALDEATGGLPRPGIVELVGPPGSGRTRLAVAMAARCTTTDPVVWVDVERLLFPPTAHTMGADLRRLLILRPRPDQASWALEQVLRSGCFPLVVGDGIPEVAGDAARWVRAAHTGCSTLLVLTTAPLRELQVTLRLTVAHGEVTVQRHRSGRVGARFQVPAWHEGWGA